MEQYWPIPNVMDFIFGRSSLNPSTVRKYEERTINERNITVESNSTHDLSANIYKPKGSLNITSKSQILGSISKDNHQPAVYFELEEYLSYSSNSTASVKDLMQINNTNKKTKEDHFKLSHDENALHQKQYQLLNNTPHLITPNNLISSIKTGLNRKISGGGKENCQPTKQYNLRSRAANSKITNLPRNDFTQTTNRNKEKPFMQLFDQQLYPKFNDYCRISDEKQICEMVDSSGKKNVNCDKATQQKDSLLLHNNHKNPSEENGSNVGPSHYPTQSLNSTPHPIVHNNVLQPKKSSLKARPSGENPLENLPPAKLFKLRKSSLHIPITFNSIHSAHLRNHLPTIDRAHQRFRQIELIVSKHLVGIQPHPGLLSLRKQCNTRIQLNDLKDELITKRSVPDNLRAAVATITSENAVDYRLMYSDTLLDGDKEFEEGDLIGDSCLLVHADDNTCGLGEITQAFKTSPNVDPIRIPDNWIKNHYRWIVWKLASYERVFCQSVSSRCLTAENILLQLKYRYDREIDNSQKSAFRKILECEATPNKLICCIAAAKWKQIEGGEQLLELELTDGWYSVWSIVDSELIKLFRQGIVRIGAKLIIHNATITNCEEKCNPLYVPAGVKFQISTNSVRRVKWSAKMGFTRDNNPIPTYLHCVLPNGGVIGHTSLVIVRRYPVIYTYTSEDGNTVFSNKFPQNDLTVKKYSVSNEVHKIYQRISGKFLETSRGKRNLVKFTYKEIVPIQNGEFYEIFLSDIMKRQLEEDSCATDEPLAKNRTGVKSLPNVTKILNVRVVDFLTGKDAMLTIWLPNSRVMDGFFEYWAFDFYNLEAFGSRNGVLQLSNIKQSQFIRTECSLRSSEFRRTLTSFEEIRSPGFSPMFGEIDIIGIVVLITMPKFPNDDTVVFLTDGQGNYLSMTSIISLAASGYDEIIKEGAIVICSNLQWRSECTQRKIPSVVVSELTTFSQKPQDFYVYEGIDKLKTNLLEKGLKMVVADSQAQLSK